MRGVIDMRHWYKYIVIIFTLAVVKSSFANPPESKLSKNIETYIKASYDKFQGQKVKSLSYPVYRKALIGYINLKNDGKLPSTRNVLTICDLSMSSNKKRMWILDLDKHKVLLNTYVAHGQGSGNEYANQFSNLPNSHQSSMGFYVTASTYVGKHGNSLRLIGMDKGFNCAAMDRAIVLHGADYVSEDFIKNNKRLGRSWGCPAVSVEVSDKVIGYIKGGTCLFVFYPEEKYLAQSYWLNKSIEINDLIKQKKTAQPVKVVQEKEGDIIERIVKYEYESAQ